MSLGNLYSHNALKKIVPGLKFGYSFILNVPLYREVYESKTEFFFTKIIKDY